MSARRPRRGERAPQDSLQASAGSGNVANSFHIPGPSVVLCTLAPALAIGSLQKFWFTDWAATVYSYLFGVVMATCIVVAVLVAAWPSVRELVMQNLAATGISPTSYRRACIVVSYLGLFAFLFFFKYIQYRGFQLTMDTSATANLVWHCAHSWSLESSVFGIPNYLAIHFMPAVAMLAPLLLLWNDVRILMIFQCAVLASVPFAAFLLALRRSQSSICAWSAFSLVVTSPFFFNLIANNVVFQATLPAFFLWGAYFVETRRWSAAALCAATLLLTTEQSTLLFFGIGIYLVPKLGTCTKRAWLAGAGVCLSSALIAIFEIRVMRSYPRGGVLTGETFTHLAPTLPALVSKAVHEPMKLAREVFFPLDNLRPLCRLLLSGGGLFLLSPYESIPWIINFIPSLLSRGYYHDLRLHYAAYVTGPFWWPVVLGTASAYLWLEQRKQTYWLVVFSLLWSARNIFFTPAILLRSFNQALFTEGPVLTALIPPHAPVWAMEYLTPWLSCRPSIWVLDTTSDFRALRPFVPDYVLLPREWVSKAQPETRDILLTYLAQQQYVKVSERNLLVLLRHPHAPLAPEGRRPALFEPPQPDPKAAAAYASYLARNDDPADTDEGYRVWAEQGDAMAQYNLGMAYAKGAGVARDEAQAIRWLTMAAEQDFPQAQNNLGTTYARRGDWARGIMWFRRSAEHGDVSAEFNLAISLGDAPPPLKNIEESILWMRKAAEHGHPQAKMMLSQKHL